MASTVKGPILSDADIEKLDQSNGQEEVVKGAFGDVQKGAFDQGERNIAGNVFERPAAALRGALQNPLTPITGFVKGSTNPASIPTFNTLAVNSGGTNTGINFAKNMAGSAADIATNPADLLGLLIGKTPTPWGELGEVAGKTVASSSKAVGKLMRYETNLQQASKAKEALDGIRETLGNAKTLAIQQVKEAPTALDLTGASEKVIKAIKNPIYEIEINPDGSLKQTVGNLDKVKEAIGELIHTDKVWEEAPNKELRIVKQLYGKVRNEMISASDKAGSSIGQALDDYSKFMDNYNLVNKRLTDTAGNIMGNKLKDTFKFGAEPAFKQAWKEVSKASPEIKSVMNTMQRNHLLKNLLKLTATEEVIRRGAKKLGASADEAMFAGDEQLGGSGY